MSDGQVVRLSGRQPEATDGFRQWLADEGVSVVFVSGGRLWVVGTAPDGTIDVADLAFPHGAAAVAVQHETLLMAGWQVWTYRDAGPAPDGHDRLYLPQSAVTVGDVGICDIADGVFVSSRLGCLAELDPRWSFRPIWMPPWHKAVLDHGPGYLGGFTYDERAARTWVAFSARTDRAGSWKADRRAGGLLIDTRDGQVCPGLSLPRSPRAHGERVYVANAGTGELHVLTPDDGKSEVVAAWPAACTALALHGRSAIVGLASAATEDDFDLPVGGRRPPTDGDALVVVDLERSETKGTLTLHGRSRGVSSVAVIPNCRWPIVAAPRGTTARNTVVVGPHDPIARIDPIVTSRQYP